jgi:hypothetical protein
MDSYILISIYREPPLLLLAPSRLSPTLLTPLIGSGPASSIGTEVKLYDEKTKQGLSSIKLYSNFSHQGGLIGLLVDATPEAQVDAFLVRDLAGKIVLTLLRTIKK